MATLAEGLPEAERRVPIGLRKLPTECPCGRNLSAVFFRKLFIKYSNLKVLNVDFLAVALAREAAKTFSC